MVVVRWKVQLGRLLRFRVVAGRVVGDVGKVCFHIEEMRHNDVYD